MKNVITTIWHGEKKTIVTFGALFVIWLVFIGKNKYGWKGAGHYGR